MSTFPEMTARRLAGMIDHTFLKAHGTAGDIEKLCDEARRYGMAAVMVNPCEIERCLRLVEGSRARVGTVIGFPLGQNTSKVKEFEAWDAVDRGAGELDMVMNVRALQSGDEGLVRAEIAALVRCALAGGAVSKVILETCYLTDEQKRRACEIAAGEGVDFVKTSTGMAAGGATVEDVALMRMAAGPGVGVKASGGIRDLGSAMAMIAAGATRIGTSSGVSIIEEFAKGLRQQ